MKNLIIFILLIQFLESNAQQKIEINYVENQDNSVSFNYKKNVSGSYLVVLDFSNLSNTREQRRINKIVQNKSGSILKLKPINKENRIGFNYKYIYYKGNINSKINKEYPYILPFKKGEKVVPRELYSLENKYLNEKTPKGWKSYSFTFNEPKKVMAIRKGKVIEIKDIYTPDNNLEISYYSQQNLISIEHKDGSIATYKGFDKNKILVNEGETVYPQTVLGEITKFDKRNIYRLYLSLYSYTTKKNISLSTIKSSDDYEITYLTPKFFTKNSLNKLIDLKQYIVDYDEKTLFKEMRKKEIKKFKLK